MIDLSADSDFLAIGQIRQLNNLNTSKNQFWQRKCLHRFRGNHPDSHSYNQRQKQINSATASTPNCQPKIVNHNRYVFFFFVCVESAPE
ncbi:hypothetical protein [Tychonema bourrellyi]|uniref:hypothetical protein n=1 Tax=Tychonema bourrellyi TaxID=54313 RepID=UPI003CCBDC89